MAALLSLFELGILAAYAAGWGVWEGIREVVQNYLDSMTDGHEGTIRWEGSTERGTLVLENQGVVLDRAVWLMGKTSKANREDQIGQFGDGLKVGVLALLRAGLEVWIDNGDERWTPILAESRVYPGEVTLQIRTRKIHRTDYSVAVHVKGISYKAWSIMRRRFVSLAGIEPKYVDRVRWRGAMISDPEYKGMIFCKGVYIQHKDGLDCGYDFDDLQLDRDRNRVEDWNLESAISSLTSAIVDRDMQEGNQDKVAGLADRVWTSTMMENDEFKSLPSRLQYGRNKGTAALVKILCERFKRDHGTGAIPVSSADEATKVSFYGLHGVVVPKTLREILQNADGFGTVDACCQKAVEADGQDVTDTLTEAQARNFRAACRLLFLAGIIPDPAAPRVRIYRWTSPKAPLGLYNAAQVEVDGQTIPRIDVNEVELKAMTKVLGTLIHELAHDHGRDGTLGHRSAEETAWEKVSELLVAEAGIGWLAD